MYYHSNQQTNDYYNSYKREMQELHAYEKQGKIQQLMKIFFGVVVLFLLGLANYYLYKYFNPDMEMTHKIEKDTLRQKRQLPSIIISEEELPKSPQLIAYQRENSTHIQEQTTNISKKDITLIVQIIMKEIHKQKELSLEEQLMAVESTDFTPKQLKENNYYNKVILNENPKEDDKNIQNSSLVELTNQINHVLDEEPVEDKVATEYSNAIKKEIAYRENEMRVIVVKKGDTLSRIAKRAYGRYNDYRKIFSANPEIIKNPNQIYEGMRLRIPS